MSRRSPACRAATEPASCGVVLVAGSPGAASSALRSISSASARDGMDPRHTP